MPAPAQADMFGIGAFVHWILLLAFKKIDSRCRSLVTDRQDPLEFRRMKPSQRALPARKLQDHDAGAWSVAEDRLGLTARHVLTVEQRQRRRNLLLIILVPLP